VTAPILARITRPSPSVASITSCSAGSRPQNLLKEYLEPSRRSTVISQVAVIGFSRAARSLSRSEQSLSLNFDSLDAGLPCADLRYTLNPGGDTALDYIVLVTRGSDNVDTAVISANSNDEALGAAKAWAATLGLAPDDDVVLRVKLPGGTFKAFLRKDF
jgi:hypothetical protein